MEYILCLLFCRNIQTAQIKYEEPKAPIIEERVEVKSSVVTHKPDAPKDSGVRRGYASSYSATWGGCLGCTKYFDEKGQLYYKTATGERLDDSKYTLASNDIPMHTLVSVCNTRNSKCVGAKVNDTGGFSTPKYNNRIADLSVATALAIDHKTNQDIIEITIKP